MQTIHLDVTTEKSLKEGQIKAVDDLNKQSGDCLCDHILVIPKDENGETINMNNEKPNWQKVVDETSKIRKTGILFIFTIIMFLNNHSSIPSIPSSSITVKITLISLL
jgi:hypothetical protein